jgi:endoglucanase
MVAGQASVGAQSATPSGSPSASPSPQATPTGADESLFTAETSWFIDPNSNAARLAREWAASRPADATQMEKIAGQPQADWFGEWSGDVGSAVDARVTEITAAGALPVLVAYNIPFRDCGHYSAGGQNDPDSYRQWITAFADGIGDRPAAVIVEPDGLALTDCLDATQTTERFALLAFAVETLEAKPQVAVYIDAGHSNWLPAAEAARRLEFAGIDGAAGFALNVSNFQRTEDLIAFGRDVSTAIGDPAGTHFVLDTSRNGNGPWESTDPETWCNPPDRALGEPPTVDTADPLVDAYLWIKRPGESDGACRGAPPAGTWWPEYALGLAQRARW